MVGWPDLDADWNYKPLGLANLAPLRLTHISNGGTRQGRYVAVDPVCLFNLKVRHSSSILVFKWRFFHKVTNVVNHLIDGCSNNEGLGKLDYFIFTTVQ